VSEAEALYIREGDAFVGTECTKGAWGHGGQAGGAVLALLGHVLEDVPTLTPMSLTRLTVDIVRPVPVGERLQVATEIVR
jgi:acyl dehydratase